MYTSNMEELITRSILRVVHVCSEKENNRIPLICHILKGKFNFLNNDPINLVLIAMNLQGYLKGNLDLPFFQFFKISTYNRTFITNLFGIENELFYKIRKYFIVDRTDEKTFSKDMKINLLMYFNYSPRVNSKITEGDLLLSLDLYTELQKQVSKIKPEEVERKMRVIKKFLDDNDIKCPSRTIEVILPKNF